MEAWRLRCFIEMGATVPLAERLARSKVDLHEFEQLLNRGCSPTLAADILT